MLKFASLKRRELFYKSLINTRNSIVVISLSPSNIIIYLIRGIQWQWLLSKEHSLSPSDNTAWIYFLEKECSFLTMNEGCSETHLLVTSIQGDNEFIVKISTVSIGTTIASTIIVYWCVGAGKTVRLTVLYICTWILGLNVDTSLASAKFGFYIQWEIWFIEFWYQYFRKVVSVSFRDLLIEKYNYNLKSYLKYKNLK